MKEAFVEVLRLASEMKLLKVSVDETHIRANASRHKDMRYDRAGQLERQLRQDVEELLQQAESQDRQDEVDGQKLPEEIARRERLREKMLEAIRNALKLSAGNRRRAAQILQIGEATLYRKLKKWVFPEFRDM